MPNPLKEMTLTQSVFDVADCNIAQRYLTDGTNDPLPFSGAATYNALYRSIVDRKTTYADVRKQEGAILKELRGAYSPNKFWQRYLRSRDEQTYARAAWENLVPIAATWKPRLDVVLPPGMNVQVRPKPLVLLYPLGWTTWINFLIDGDCSLGQLAALTTHLMDGAAYQLDGKPEPPLTLQDVFDRVGKGVREDGYDALVFSSQDVLSVATVLGKHGGSPSLGALSGDESKALKQIIRSGGAAPVPNLAINLRGGDKLLDFVLHDGFSWFLWAEQRLQPSKRNAQTLRCYHNNTVRSLLQAWLLQEFLAEATRIDPWGAVLTDLVKRAMRLLAIPTYKNLSTIAFLERKDFQAVRAEVQKRL